MRTRPLLTSLALGAALMTWPMISPRADQSPAEKLRRSATVAQIGPTSISVGELEDWLAQVPRFQLKAFGDSPDAIRRKFLDQVVLPEVLYALAAERQHMGDQLPASNKILRTKAGATTKVVVAGVRPISTIKMSEIQRYYDANRAKFDAPERLSVFRILCASPQEAAVVLDEARREPTVENFTRLAHDHSADKATLMRGGNLGYLTPDGVSNEAGLMVDPAIVKAASTVKDGEFVPQPVPEKMGAVSTGYAVVWRRGTVPASHRTVEQAAGQIRDAILEGRGRRRREEARRRSAGGTPDGAERVAPERHRYHAELGRRGDPAASGRGSSVVAGGSQRPASNELATVDAGSASVTWAARAMMAASAAARSARRFERPSPRATTASPISTSTSNEGS